MDRRGHLAAAGSGQWPKILARRHRAAVRRCDRGVTTAMSTAMTSDRAHIIAVSILQIVLEVMRDGGDKGEARDAVASWLRDEIAGIERQIRDELSPG